MLFLEPPEDFKPLFTASGCYLIHDEHFLIMQYVERKGATWGPPGGKQDAGETIHQAIQRELEEETGFTIPLSRLTKVATYYVRYPDFDFIYVTFYSRVHTKTEPVMDGKEHQAYQWVTPQEALKMNLIRDEDACIEHFFHNRLPGEMSGEASSVTTHR